jgi:hypothetical protein
MRKLVEIVDDLKDNVAKPVGDEAEHAILVLDQLNQVFLRNIGELCGIVRAIHPVGDTILQETAEHLKAALLISPTEFLAGNVPGTEPYDTNRKAYVEQMNKLKEELEKLYHESEKAVAEEEAKVLKDEDKLN